MIAEIDAVFKKYERLVDQVDVVFKKVREQYPELVKCELQCSDCCHAVFDITLVEALYINKKFMQNVFEEKKAVILDKANTADRTVYRMKKKAFKAVEAGEKSEEQVLLEMAAERIRCPLLNNEERCELYEYRPITCRLYGIPTSIGGRGHTCGLSGLKEGESYPTANLDPIYGKLYELSQEIVTLIKSRYVQMGKVLMPLSMALLTVFDEEYLGVGQEKAEKEEKGG